MESLVLLVAKYLLYCVWMYVGLYIFRGDKPGYIAAALALGFLRLIVGLIVGIASIAVVGPRDATSVIITIMPGSFLLWFGAAWLMNGRLESRSVYWTLAGYTISVASDTYAALLPGSMTGGKWYC